MKEYPTPTAKGDTCMKSKRYAQGGHPLTLVVGVEEGVIEPPADYAWPNKEKGLWRTPDCGRRGGQPEDYLERMADGDYSRPTTGTQIELTLKDQIRHSGLYPAQAKKDKGGQCSKGSLTPIGLNG